MVGDKSLLLKLRSRTGVDVEFSSQINFESKTRYLNRSLINFLAPSGAFLFGKIFSMSTILLAKISIGAMLVPLKIEKSCISSN